VPPADRKLSPGELGRAHPAAYAPLPGRRVVAVLEDVRSRHNVGSVFRTADAFGLEGIVLCGLTPLPPHRDIEKTALGATLTVPWEHAPDALVAVERLKARGLLVYAVEQTIGAVRPQDTEVPADRPLALVFGNELRGVSDAVIAACDGCLALPQHGSKHSLNVAVCAGVVLWWFAGRHVPSR